MTTDEKRAAFDSADLYSCDDSAETMDAESPAQAMVERYEQTDHEGPVHFTNGGLTVYAYKRSEVSEREIERWSESALEGFCESHTDEYEPEGCDDWFSDADLTACRKAVAKAFRKLLASRPSYACDPCGEREYTQEEALAMMRECAPELFADEEPTP